MWKQTVKTSKTTKKNDDKINTHMCVLSDICMYDSMAYDYREVPSAQVEMGNGKR